MKFTMIVPDECKFIACTLLCDMEMCLQLRQTIIEPSEGSTEIIRPAEERET